MLKFVNSKSLVSRVKESLHSYNSAGLIDEGKFYYWIKEALYDLGLNVMQPANIIVPVNKYKVALPDDLIEFYSIHRLNAHQEIKRLNKQSDVSWYIETGICDYQKKKCCEIESEGTVVRQKIYLEDKVQHTNSFNKVGLLRYVPNNVWLKDRCNKFSPYKNSKTTYYNKEQDFNCDDSYFYFNFTDDYILLQYHAFPTDEDGLPLVPDNPIVQKFIEKKISYELLCLFYMNSDVPDMVNKLALAEKQYTIARSDAEFWNKLPSFKELVAYKQSQISNFQAFER